MKDWKIAIIKDSSKPMLGLHGLHTAFRGLPNVTVVALVGRFSSLLVSVRQFPWRVRLPDAAVRVTRCCFPPSGARQAGTPPYLQT